MHAPCPLPRSLDSDVFRCTGSGLPRRVGSSEHVPHGQGVVQGESGIREALSEGVDLIIGHEHEGRDPFCQRAAGGNERPHFGLKDGSREEMALGDVEGEEGELKLLGQLLWVRGESCLRRRDGRRHGRRRQGRGQGEDASRGNGVCIGVELCQGGDVPWGVDRASHYHYFLHSEERLWVLGSSSRQVGQGSDGKNCDCIGLVFTEQS